MQKNEKNVCASLRCQATRNLSPLVSFRMEKYSIQSYNCSVTQMETKFGNFYFVHFRMSFGLWEKMKMSRMNSL